MMEMCDPPPHFKKGKGVVFRRFEGFSFGLLRVVGKTALLRGVCVDESRVGMPLPSLTLLSLPLRPPKELSVCVVVLRKLATESYWVPRAHGVL